MGILPKRKLSKLLLSLGFIALIAPFQASALTDREDLCGKVRPVKGFTADISGLSIKTDAYNRLSVNGKVVYDKEPEPWWDSANSARIAQSGDDVLVLMAITDCVDITLSRIYVIAKNGSLRTTSRLWTENWPSGFVTEPGALTYWSEYFCFDDNKDRQPGKSYVYTLKNGAKDFVREDRPTDALCAKDGTTALKGSAIRFTGMKPVAP